MSDSIDQKLEVMNYAPDVFDFYRYATLSWMKSLADYFEEFFGLFGKIHQSKVFIGLLPLFCGEDECFAKISRGYCNAHGEKRKTPRAGKKISNTVLSAVSGIRESFLKLLRMYPSHLIMKTSLLFCHSTLEILTGLLGVNVVMKVLKITDKQFCDINLVDRIYGYEIFSQIQKLHSRITTLEKTYPSFIVLSSNGWQVIQLDFAELPSQRNWSKVTSVHRIHTIRRGVVLKNSIFFESVLIYVMDTFANIQVIDVYLNPLAIQQMFHKELEISIPTETPSYLKNMSVIKQQPPSVSAHAIPTRANKGPPAKSVQSIGMKRSTAPSLIVHVVPPDKVKPPLSLPVNSSTCLDPGGIRHDTNFPDVDVVDLTLQASSFTRNDKGSKQRK